LANEGIDWGLLGPSEGARIWSRHLLNCAAVASAFEPGARVVDLGSGAGLPGIPIALARPDLTVVLLEPLARRVRFLELVLPLLGLPGVSVRRARAEECRGLGVDAVTARAVAPIDRLAGWALPLLRRGGELVAIRGAAAAEELVQARDALSRLGAAEARIELFGGESPAEPVHVLRLKASRTTPPAGARRRST
jgi:16S rRNA (guanine527-N7)-methyltransferase